MHETLIRQTDQSLAASNTQYASTPSSNAISSEPSSPSSSSLPKGEKAGSTPRFQNQAVQMLSELRDSLERTGLPSRLRSEILSSMRSSALSLHQGRKFDPEDLKQRCQTILHKSLGRTDQSILLVKAKYLVGECISKLNGIQKRQVIDLDSLRARLLDGLAGLKPEPRRAIVASFATACRFLNSPVGGDNPHSNFDASRQLEILHRDLRTILKPDPRSPTTPMPHGFKGLASLTAEQRALLEESYSTVRSAFKQQYFPHLHNLHRIPVIPERSNAHLRAYLEDQLAELGDAGREAILDHFKQAASSHEAILKFDRSKFIHKLQLILAKKDRRLTGDRRYADLLTTSQKKALKNAVDILSDCRKCFVMKQGVRLLDEVVANQAGITQGSSESDQAQVAEEPPQLEVPDAYRAHRHWAPSPNLARKRMIKRLKDSFQTGKETFGTDPSLAQFVAEFDRKINEMIQGVDAGTVTISNLTDTFRQLLASAPTKDGYERLLHLVFDPKVLGPLEPDNEAHSTPNIYLNLIETCCTLADERRSLETIQLNMAGHVWRDAIDHLKDHTTRWGNDESRIFMPLIGDGMNQVIESDLAHALKSLHRCLSGVIRGKWASRTAIGFAKILSGAKTQGTSCFEVTPKGTSTKCYLPSPEWLIKNFAPQEAAVTT